MGVLSLIIDRMNMDNMIPNSWIYIISLIIKKSNLFEYFFKKSSK